jgi:hypothetical protein
MLPTGRGGEGSANAGGCIDTTSLLWSSSAELVRGDALFNDDPRLGVIRSGSP